MFDPIQIPNELPVNSLKILLDFAITASCTDYYN